MDQVLLADGTSKAIEDVVVGDLVLAGDPESGETSARPVVDTYVHEDVETYAVETSTGTVTSTAEHPFWVEGRGWTPVRELQPGDKLVDADGVRVELVAVTPTGETATVHNLNVEGLHSYHVGAGDSWVLVHNNCSSDLGPGVPGGVDNLQNPAQMATDDALDTATDFLGPNYRDMSGGRFLSEDGLRQVRMTDRDLAHPRQNPHINFETYPQPIGPGMRGSNPTSNHHIYLPEEPGWH